MTNEKSWKEKLSPIEYHVLREKGTESAFTGEYTHHKAKGTYFCKGCGITLFRSEAKYDSGCGWPSFFGPISEKSVKIRSDFSFGMQRTEVLCPECGGHLGHVFDDGPDPDGLRYCINSVSLDFKGDE